MCDKHSLRSACAYAQSDQSLCFSLEYSMTVKLLTLSKKEGKDQEYNLAPHLTQDTHGKVTPSGVSKLSRGVDRLVRVKMPNCWKSHVAAHVIL